MEPIIFVDSAKLAIAKLSVFQELFIHMHTYNINGILKV